MKSQILITLIASLQLAAPALALEQSEWVTPGVDQVDIVGGPATAVNPAAASAAPSVPMQSGWITQNEQAAPAQSAPTNQTATGQSGWVKPGDQTELSCPATVKPARASESLTPIQGSTTRDYRSSGASAAGGAVGKAVGTALSGAAGAAAAAGMMMAANSMMYGGHRYGYGSYGGFRGYTGWGGGGYYGRGANFGRLMGGAMLQQAAYRAMRGY